MNTALQSGNNSVALLSIITVTYNSENEIQNFVSSIEDQGVSCDVWLVDNASTDGTCSILKKLAQNNNHLNIILNEKNIGLAAANNLPLTKIKTPYVAIINPDVVLHSEALSELTTYLENNLDVVAVAPVNVDVSGNPHSSFHKNWSLFHLLIWRLFPASLTKIIYSLIRDYKEQDVLFASGACIVMRSVDFVNIGGYDPEYFLTVEDVCDLCIRLRLGDPHKRVVVTPKAKITHYGSRSGVAVPFTVLWNGARGSVYHFRKHGGTVAGICALCIVFINSLLRVIQALLLVPFKKNYSIKLSNNWSVLCRLVIKNPFITANKIKKDATHEVN